MSAPEEHHEGVEQPAKRRGPKKKDPDTTVRDVVDRLFREHLHPDGREYYLTEVVDTIKGRYQHLLGDAALNRSHLSKLRSGDIKDPGRRVIMALCAFFHVPVSTFYPELEQEQHQVDIGATLRAAGLSPQAQMYVRGLIAELQRNRDDRREPAEASDTEKPT